MLKLKFILPSALLAILTLSPISADNNDNNKNSQESEVQLFPNPVINGFLNIRANDHIGQIEIVNVLGQSVAERKKIQSDNLRLNISHFEKGMYLVKCTLVSGKIITNRILVK